MSNGNKSKAVQGDEIVKLRYGVLTFIGKTGKLKVQGKEVKGSDMLDSLDALIAAINAAAAAREVFRTAVAEEDAQLEQLRPLMVVLRATFRMTLSAQQLATCGLTAKRGKRTLSADERIAKTAKLRATRMANHTQGARQERLAKARATIAAVFGGAGGTSTAPAATSPPTGDEPAVGAPATATGNGNAAGNGNGAVH